LFLVEHLDAPCRIVPRSGRHTANKRARTISGMNTKDETQQSADIMYPYLLVDLDAVGTARTKLDCRLVQRVYSQTDISNDKIYKMKNAMNNGKTKPENPGLKGRVVGFGQTWVTNPNGIQVE